MALVMDRPEEARGAAEFLLSSDLAGPVAQRLGRQLLSYARVDDPAATDLNLPQAIRRLRQELQLFPRNPHGWVDLSRLYAVSGQNASAERAIEIAVGLGREDRLTLRSATRFYLHIGDSQRALRLLRRSRATERDPWLLAAELATASVAGATSRFMREARSFLKESGLSPWHLSELASALATTELSGGNARRARQLFEQALASPTDNAVAQGQWAKRWLQELEIPDSALVIPRAHEARSWERYEAGNWKSALDAAEKWLGDEPFSSRPAVMSSFISSVVLQEYDRSIEFCRRGLRANPDDQLLRNNLVFALASSDRLKEAIEEAKLMRTEAVSGTDAIAWTATQGLLAFRGGKSLAGRRLYEDAIEMSRNNNRMRAFATAFLAREELLAGTMEWRNALDRAKHEGRLLRSKVLDELLVNIEKLGQRSRREGER